MVDNIMSHKDPLMNDKVGFADIAKQEFTLTAMAFFAPVVGTVMVMRKLIEATAARAAQSPTEPPPASKVKADLKDAA